MRLYFLSSLVLFSGISVPLFAVPPLAPTGLVAYAPNQDRVHLSWIDNATDEAAYWVERWDGGEWIFLGGLSPNLEICRLAAPSAAEQTVRYRVAPFKTGETPENLNWVEVEVLKPAGTLDLLVNGPPFTLVPEGSEARAGVPFSFDIEVYEGDSPESYTYTAQDLPNGVTLDAVNGTISGTISDPGVYRIFNGILFDTDKKFDQLRFIRVLPAASTPVIVSSDFSVPTQEAGGTVGHDISAIFADPGRPKGACFNTSLGSFIVALHDEATPKTVDNFLGYSNRADYDNSYLHRAVFGFIIQGGGARPASPSATPRQWTNIPRLAAIQNEPGISNRRGTVAMARSSVIDSATSEWFVSTGVGNPDILDRQNGGFTVFGEVLGASGMAVVDALSARPTRNYSGIISGTSGVALQNVPVLDAVAPASPGPNSLVRVHSILEAPAVSVEVVSNSAPTVLSASVSGMVLVVRSLGPTGTAHLVLRAMNLDGNTVDFPLSVSMDDHLKPTIKLTRVKAKGSSGKLLIKGIATDQGALKSWKYRINKKKWKRGGNLSGTQAKFSRTVRGFKHGKNKLELQAFDAKGNASAVLKQRITFR